MYFHLTKLEGKTKQEQAQMLLESVAHTRDTRVCIRNHSLVYSFTIFNTMVLVIQVFFM